MSVQYVDTDWYVICISYNFKLCVYIHNYSNTNKLIKSVRYICFLSFPFDIYDIVYEYLTCNAHSVAYICCNSKVVHYFVVLQIIPKAATLYIICYRIINDNGLVVNCLCVFFSINQSKHVNSPL